MSTGVTVGGNEHMIMTLAPAHGIIPIGAAEMRFEYKR